jgi:hypothetical protein
MRAHRLNQPIIVPEPSSEAARGHHLCGHARLHSASDADPGCPRERKRLWQHFQLMRRRTDVAARLFEALQRKPRSRASITGRLAS